MTIFCNVGSVILGLGAWIIPLLALKKKYRFGLCCIGSLCCCTSSLFLQLLEVRNRVCLHDWSALLDTMGVVVLAAVIMIVVTLISNAAALFWPNKR